MRSGCLARAINRSLLTEFAAVRGFKVRNLIFGEISSREGRGNRGRSWLREFVIQVRAGFLSPHGERAG